MNCSDIQENIGAYLDGELPAKERRMLDAHAESCGKCSREISEIKATLALLDAVPDIDPPRDFVDQVRSRINDEDQEETSSVSSANGAVIDMPAPSTAVKRPWFNRPALQVAMAACFIGMITLFGLLNNTIKAPGEQTNLAMSDAVTENAEAPIDIAPMAAPDAIMMSEPSEEKELNDPAAPASRKPQAPANKAKVLSRSSSPAIEGQPDVVESEASLALPQESLKGVAVAPSKQSQSKDELVSAGGLNANNALRQAAETEPSDVQVNDDSEVGVALANASPMLKKMERRQSSKAGKEALFFADSKDEDDAFAAQDYLDSASATLFIKLANNKQRQDLIDFLKSQKASIRKNPTKAKAAKQKASLAMTITIPPDELNDVISFIDGLEDAVTLKLKMADGLIITNDIPSLIIHSDSLLLRDADIQLEDISK